MAQSDRTQAAADKRAMVEPARLLSAYELADQVCTCFGCAHKLHRVARETIS